MQVTKPIIIVRICYKLLCVFETSLILASDDIKAFGCTYVGRAAYWPFTSFTPRVFLFSISIYMHDNGDYCDKFIVQLYERKSILPMDVNTCMYICRYVRMVPL